MIIVGEKLNSSIPKTLSAIQDRDEQTLAGLIRSQEACGADYLDINAAVGLEHESEKLIWLAQLVMRYSKCGIMLDSPSPAVISQAIKTLQGRPVIINSVTLSERIDELLPTILETGASVVALPIDAVGIPADPSKRVENALLLVQKLTGSGVAKENIFIDVLAETLSVCDSNLVTAIRSIIGIKKADPDIKTICGVSNVSFGLPKRININSAFLSAAIVAGLDSAILDITSPAIRTALASSLAVAGLDEYCLNYISHTREDQ